MEKVALLVIDVQNGMFRPEYMAYKGNELLQRLGELIKKARAAGAPVFYIQHNAPEGRLLETGTHAWEIHPEIAPQEHEMIIQKHTPDSFYHTTLDEELKNQGIKELVLAGIQTEACVDTTCRRAFSLEYKVTLASDAHSTWDSGSITAQQIIDHHNGVLRWFADVYPVQEIEFC
ncbi:cysteine hydrolase family protein [Peribacillus sp. SCS-26]|uniref:cysteine hydrolase family protein n=1 Tax=Paraperibacillus marinus TaxID=3115295 RepID=UPI003905CADA